LQQDRVSAHLHFVWVVLHVKNGCVSGLIVATLSLGHLLSLIFYKMFSYFGVCRLEYNTMQYSTLQYSTRRVGTVVTHAPWPSLIFCAALIFMCLAAPCFEHCAVSCWQRCPHIHLVSWKVDQAAWVLMWPKLHSQKMYEAISAAHLLLFYLGLFTGPSLNRCPFKWQCPVNTP